MRASILLFGFGHMLGACLGQEDHEGNNGDGTADVLSEVGEGDTQPDIDSREWQTAPSDATDDATPDAAPDDDERCQTLTLEPEYTESETAITATIEDDDFVAGGVEVARTIDLVHAPGYPTHVVLWLDSPAYRPCQDRQPQPYGEATLTGGEGVVGAAFDGTLLTLDVLAAGETVLTLETVVVSSGPAPGACADHFPAGVRVPLTQRIRVRAAVPHDFSILNLCDTSEPVLGLPGRSLGSTYIELRGASGGQFMPRNVSPLRPLPFDVRFCSEAPFELETAATSLAEVVLPDVPGSLTISSPMAGVRMIDVLGPDDLRSFDVDFVTITDAGTWLSTLDDGGRYDGPWNGSARRVVPYVTPVFDVPGTTCEPLPSTWFELTAGPAGVCEVRPAPSGLYENSPRSVGLSAYLVADGTCTLELTSSANDSSGQISATFANVDQMIDDPR